MSRNTKRSVKRFRTSKKDEQWSNEYSSGKSKITHNSAKYLTDMLAGAISLLLGVRFVSLIYGMADRGTVGHFIYLITQPLVKPFIGVVPDSTIGTLPGSKVEAASLLSILAIAFIGYSFRQLYESFTPGKSYKSQVVTR